MMRTIVPNTTAGSRLRAVLAPNVTVLDVQVEPEVVLLTVASSSSTAACPRCATESARLHSSYIRQPQDLPISGRTTRLVLHARRFRCVNPACSTVTFAERLPNLVAVAAQRTIRLNAELRDRALAFGGEAGARQSVRSAMSASGDTLLRRAHTATLRARAIPRVLGLDDFAFQKGRRYGTILTDGETKDVVDVLPDRTAEPVAAWLKDHPGVELVPRDRSTEYARGVTTGAPDAIQVADRWHVLGNLREALERLRDRLRPQLLGLPPENHLSSLRLRSSERDRRRGTKDQARQQASRIQRYRRYADVKRLQVEGKAILQIARELKLSRQTVRKYMASDRFPDYPQLRQQRSSLDP
jgi:transposase